MQPVDDIQIRNKVTHKFSAGVKRWCRLAVCIMHFHAIIGSIIKQLEHAIVVVALEFTWMTLSLNFLLTFFLTPYVSK